MNEPVDQYVQQLENIRRRLLSYPEGHIGLQLAACARMSDLIRLGRFDAVKRIAEGDCPEFWLSRTDYRAFS